MTDTRTRRLVLVGATGAVGGHVLDTALRSPVYAGLTTLGRRRADTAPDAPTERLAQHLVDVADAASYRDLLPGHSDAISTLGVGDPARVAFEELWRVEVDYVVGFARACRDAGVERFSLMTSVGADARSASKYLRLKGTLEQRVRELGFPRLSLVRPSMILTPTNRYGVLQGITLAVWPRLHWAMRGRLRAARGIRVDELGRAIALDAAHGSLADGTRVLAWDELQAALKAG